VVDAVSSARGGVAVSFSMSSGILGRKRVLGRGK
jgi:hypothetical protein